MFFFFGDKELKAMDESNSGKEQAENSVNQNEEKQLHGQNGITSLEQMVETLKNRDYIVEYTKNYSIGDPEKDDKQFKSQFMIEFQDSDEWLLHSTTTIRDRIKQQQWDFSNIKRLNAYVKKGYVVVPDGMDPDEQKKATQYNESIVNGKIVSAVDGVVTLSEAYSLVEHKGAELLSSGKAHAILGLHFEEKIADAINNRQNFEKWNGDDPLAVGYLYNLFSGLVEKFDLNPNSVRKLTATTKIPKLESGGSPKTDVLIVAYFVDGSRKNYTISCKRSNAKSVSMHEYTADDFASVLNPSDMELREYLLEFQKAGGITELGKQKAEELEEILSQYNEKLTRWVLAGEGGEGDPDTQWAQYIMLLDDESGAVSIYTINEYIIHLEEQGAKGQLGTYFAWTYPSSGKGKRIQLKGKMI